MLAREGMSENFISIPEEELMLAREEMSENFISIPEEELTCGPRTTYPFGLWKNFKRGKWEDGGYLGVTGSCPSGFLGTLLWR